MLKCYYTKINELCNSVYNEMEINLKYYNYFNLTSKMFEKQATKKLL